MINWQSVIFNSFWIFGSAIILAALSYYYWQAEQEGQRVRTKLGGIGFQRTLWLGLAFIAIGLAGTSIRFGETILWSLIALIAIVSLLVSYR